MFARTVLLVTALALISVLDATADESDWDIAANVDVQTRYFTQGPQWPGQDTGSTGVSLAASMDLRWRNADGNQRASIIPMLRWDAIDDERSLLDLSEAYWAFEHDAVELLVGSNVVFWGVTESVHLVDIVNQTDAAGDIDGEDKLGQPMLNIDLQRDWGRVGLFLMPIFRERTFAGVDGRLRTPLPVDSDRTVYESGDEQRHFDVAFRYSHYLGDIDIGLSVFKGTSREPRLTLSGDGTKLIPHYDQIAQAGLDLQYTGDAWLWKLEAIARDGYADTFVAAVGGFEYTFYQLGNSASDLGLLLEYQYDGRSASEPLTLADNDVFIGARLALNDSQDTAVLAGIAYDTQSGEAFVNIEADRRLGSNYVLEGRLRLFTGAEPADAAFAIVNDDYLQLQLSRYF